MKNNKIVGLVLFEFPAFSETFFINLIKTLTKNEFIVIVLANQRYKKFKHSKDVSFNKKGKDVKALLIFFRMINFFFAVFLTPKKCIKLFILNKNDNQNIFKNFKSIIYSSYIVRHNLDFINFGFVNVSLGFENVPLAMNAKSIVSMRGFDISVFPLNHSVSYEKIFNKIDVVHSISYDLLKRAYTLGLPQNKAHTIITPAIDTKLFKLSNEKKFEVVYSLKNNRIKISSVGRLHWIKNYKDILKSLQILKYKFGVDFTFDIIGVGNEIESLNFLVNELNLSENVNFFGNLSSVQIKKVLEDSDIFIQYSLHEGFCNALIEAQCMGCVVVASNVGAIPENIIDNVTGFLVESQRPDLLAGKLLSIINLDSNHLKDIKLAAMHRVNTEFNLELQAEKFLKLFSN